MEPFELRWDDDLLLAPPTEADIDAITAACQDPDIQRNTLVPAPYRRSDAVQFVTRFAVDSWRRGSPVWAIHAPAPATTAAGSWQFCGVVGIHDVYVGSGEIGFWLAPTARGRGLAHRSVGLCLDAAFGVLGLQRVEWRAFVGNWASWRTVWRHGFRKEGEVRGFGVQRGMRRDQWIGTLLATDPRHPAQEWDGPPAASPEPQQPPQ